MANQKREEVIKAICERTGKTREQADALLDILGSAFRRRGLIEGEPLTDEQTTQRVDTWLGSARSVEDGETQQ